MATSNLPAIGATTVNALAFIRHGAPSRSAVWTRKVPPGTRLDITSVVVGEKVSLNDRWYALAGDDYIWSGACEAVMPVPADSKNAGAAPSAGTVLTGGPGPQVHRRADGTILPLATAALETTFGKFAYAEAGKGRITITDGWVDAHIIEVPTSILTEEGYPRVSFHTRAAPFLTRVFGAIQAAGLQELILSCAGTFVPRHKGWDPKRGLSPHSWGIAIDLNAAWNGYGAPPAPFGAVGSVRQLVPYFEAEGFAWGGYFSSPYQDGMHFELARLDV